MSDVGCGNETYLCKVMLFVDQEVLKDQPQLAFSYWSRRHQITRQANSGMTHIADTTGSPPKVTNPIQYWVNINTVSDINICAESESVDGVTQGDGDRDGCGTAPASYTTPELSLSQIKTLPDLTSKCSLRSR